jgi:hypothetical protein
LPSNEWWTQSTVDVGAVPLGIEQPLGTGNYYSTTAAIRVSFLTSNGLTWYRCHVRTADSSIRNCVSIGTGQYSIAQVGDARVLSLENEPAEAAAIGTQRVFVERSGKVYFGSLNRPRTVDTVRLNLPAVNTLLVQLGMPPIVP